MAATVATLAIVSALAVGAFRLALELLPQYESQVADTVRAATGLRLSFDSLDARLGWYGPEIYFKGARIVDRDGGVLVTARAGRASLAVLRSIWFRRLEIGRVILESPRLNLLIFPDRHVELVGQAGFAKPPEQPRTQRGLDRIPRGVIEIRDATVAFRDLAAGGASWELTRVDLELSREGSSIALDGRVSLPARLGRSVEFEASASGDLETLRETAWRARVSATDIDVAGWVKLLPRDWPLPSAGRGSFRVSARGQGANVERGRANLQMTGVTLPAPAGHGAVTYRRMAGDATLVHDDGQWRLAGSQVELSLPGAAWKPTDFDLRVGLSDGKLERIGLRAGFLRIDNLTPLATFLPAGGLRERLEAAAPRGVLSNVDVGIVPVGPGRMPDLTGVATFRDVGFAPIGRAPGVTGLDGRFEGHGSDALVVLDASDVEVNWPEKWRSVRPFQHVGGRVEFSRALGGVRVAVDDGQVEAPHGEATARVRMLLRPGETPLMDIAAHARVDDIAIVRDYLPRDRIKAKALQWLDDAFLRGTVTDAELQLTGPAHGFPYREGQGVFRVTADVQDATLHYAPGWPDAAGLNARVEFRGPGMQVDATAGTVGGLAISAASADVDDWRDGFLVVRAETQADAGAACQFLSASPLATKLGDTFARLKASGPLSAQVVLFLPVHDLDQHVATVQGRADGVTLALDGVDAPATAVSGEFWVRNREFYAPKLTGQLLGGPASVTVTSEQQDGDALRTRIEAAGTLDGSRLPRVARLPLNAGLAGRTAWHASWVLQRPGQPDEPMTSSVRIDSDLAGLASGLPAPLAKKPDESRPLSIGIDTEGEDGLLVRASLGRNLRSLLEFRRGDDGLHLSRGTVRLGGGEVGSLPVVPGLHVDGRVPYLSVTDLTSLEWPGPPGRPLQDTLASVSLDVGRLEVLGYEFDAVSGSMRPGNHAWDVDVTSPAARGSLLIPYRFPGDVPLVADLDRLKVSPRVRGGDGEADPRSLPGMRIDVRDLTFLDWRLGHLTARLDHLDDGIELTDFSIDDPAYQASGSGAWKHVDGGTRSSLQLKLQSHDVRNFLRAIAMAPVIEAKNGQLDADVNWPGGPDADVLERISGAAHIQLSSGRMLSVEPGAGRILGLMSLSHLGKRLALDFKDLTGRGLSFDTVKGDFKLDAGDAYTDNLTLRGSAAEIGIAGRTDLRHRTYDQTAVVTGDLGASLGVAGALAGGPAVGAALLLFSQIFKEPLKGVARAYYRITGPWDNPEVRKIDAKELSQAAGESRPPAEPAAGDQGAAQAPPGKQDGKGGP